MCLADVGAGRRTSPGPWGETVVNRLSPIDSDGTVPVYRPYLGPEVQEAARSALEVGWLGMGKLSMEFEQGIERFLRLDGRRAVATNSCTEALHLAGQLIGLGPGDEVICPSFTYVAGHQAISRTGASVVFCDVEDEYLTIDPDRVRELITDRTRAILVVDYLGLPARVDELVALARDHGLRVIEDAAHAFGSLSDGRPIGSFGDITCFSFGPVKTITTLEGGAIITPDPADVQTLHELRHLGIDADTDARYRNARNWEFDVVRQGYRCHLGSVPAAIGLAQLAMVDEFIANRQEYCRHYDAAFRDVEGLTLFDTDWKDVAPYIYVVRTRDPDERGRLMAHLKERGIATGIHFLGGHEFSYYADCRRGSLPVTERVTGQVLTLPLHPYMDEGTLARVTEGVRSFYGA